MEPPEQRERVGNRRQMRRDAIGRMKRVEPPGRVHEPVLEQLFVANREQRAAQRREHRQLVVRPFDGGESGADGLDLFTPVEGLSADEQVRNPARLDSLEIGMGDVLVVAREPPEQHRNVPRLNRHAALGPVRLPL